MYFGKPLPAPCGDFRDALCRLGRTFSIEALCADPVAALARTALQQSGKLAQRWSPLQPLFVFWFVICLAILRSDSIPALFERLVVALRGRVRDLPFRLVRDSALAHARRSLGVGPVRRFFRLLAAGAVRRATFHGLRVSAIDGVRLNVPDTPANDHVFGRPKSHRGPSAFPQLFLVVLLDTVTREPLDTKISRYDGSERAAAERLLRSVGEGDLLLLDRGFFGLPFFRRIRERGTHLLCRAPAYAKLAPKGGRRARRSGDYRAIMRCRVPLAPGEPRSTHRGRPGKTKEVEMEVRVVEYRARGFKPVRLVTTLLDETIRPEDLIALYHQRGEVEIAFDEAKTTQLASAKGTLQTELRSKTPRGVFQEIYALLASYALIRRTIAAAAQAHGLAPAEVSFADSLRVITQTITRMIGAPTTDLLRLYEQLLADIAACRLDRPRRHRRYPRVVKRKVGKFPLKRAHHHQLSALDPVEAFRAATARSRRAT